MKEGQNDVFDQFKNIAIPLIGKYHGQLMLRLRPDPGNFIEANMETPYEIHLISFDSDENFQDFMRDEERKKFLYLKEQSIRTSILIKGERL